MNWTTTQNSGSDAGVVGIVQRCGDGWRAVVADLRNARPALLDVRSFRDSDIHAQLDQWFDEYEVDRVVCVLPAGGVICRNCPLPDVDDEQLDQALRLQAEAHLLGIAPAHRLGMAVLPAGIGETSRLGLVLAWPESAPVAAVPTSRPVTHTPTTAGLAALVDTQRPPDPVLWLDRADGSVAMALSHAGGIAFRATREDTTDRAMWSDSVRRMLVETAMNLTHSDAFIESIADATTTQAAAMQPDDAVLLLPDELIEAAAPRIDQPQRDRRWWAEYGILAGVALALADDHLCSLADMVDDEPIDEPSRIRNIVEVMSTPKAATWLIVAALLTMAFGPTISTWAQVQIYSVRFGDRVAAIEAHNRHEHELGMYKHLEDNAWSMTKILADLACSMPRGVELDMIRLDHGQDIAIRGTVKRRPDKDGVEVGAEMVEALGDTGIFRNVKISVGNPNNFGKYEFDLTATVARPHFRYPYPAELDFGKYTMQHRVDGKSVEEALAEATGSTPGDGSSGGPDVVATTDRTTTETPDRTSTTDTTTPDHTAPTRIADAGEEESRPRTGDVRINTENGGMNEHSNPDDRDSTGQIDPERDIPPPVSQAQVDAMSKDQAREHLQKVSKARKYAGRIKDEELETRLKGEWDMLLARLRKD